MLTRAAAFFVPASLMARRAFVVVALALLVACRESSNVGGVANGNDTNAKPATNNIVSANETTERPPVVTAAIADDGSKKTPLWIWRSKDSTPEERADAVNKLLPPESS